MPITPTYPGIYIEELPSSAHTITAAPTSITVFIGYSHPFKTNSWGKAVRLFSFTDYEREFGGFFASDLLSNALPYAVNEFFLNGGSDAYVVGIQPHYYDFSVKPPDQGVVQSATATIGNIIFTALEPVDANHPMTVTINNLAASTKDTADITITYGSRAETYRKVVLDATNKQNYIENRIGTASKRLSSLVTVTPSGPNYGTAFSATPKPQDLRYPPPFVAGSPPPGWTTFNPADFVTIFQTDGDLDKVPIFNLMALPGIADNSIWSEALAFCERKRAFLILDPPENAAADPIAAKVDSNPNNNLPLIGSDTDDGIIETIVPKSPNGALYFPYLLSNDPLTNSTVEQPPSGFVAGIFARTDLNRGVWKAPAGLETTLLNTTGVVERGRMTDLRQGVLNTKGVNCLRSFPGSGTVVFGARTLVTENPAFEQWRYIPVRRMALFIEQTLLNNLGWAILEPNDEPLWVALRTSVESFMLSLFHQGAFQGSTPSQAFQVKCDASTTTQDDINNGIVNIIVAFAPLKPAEFVIVKIAQLAGQAQS